MRVRPSKGAHLIVAREKLALSSGLIVRTDRSVLFVLPWGEHWLIGTTDTDWEYGKGRPLATSSDVGYLIDAGELRARRAAHARRRRGDLRRAETVGCRERRGARTGGGPSQGRLSANAQALARCTR